MPLNFCYSNGYRLPSYYPRSSILGDYYYSMSGEMNILLNALDSGSSKNLYGMRIRNTYLTIEYKITKSLDNELDNKNMAFDNKTLNIHPPFFLRLREDFLEI